MSLLRTTRFGFKWGPVKVTRLTHLRKGNREYHVVEVNGVEVYVSKTGRSVRVFRAGKEMK